ncbi:hypothetical protein ACTHPH_05620 [Paenibacillus pasadenensis]|uniref:Uncharacterized protein n=1 Tax=Paenibacillus pasadenensis TaxID=217090 RepID=A0A2N5ND02_9BACL|nr:hypothetical protein [Paenibacillus pasadenensis]PLT48231.1 hypothetical protein B8V81_0363 [Paenibacillus pasadenensis]
METLAASLFFLIYALVAGVLVYRLRKGTFRRLRKENAGLVALVLLQLLLLNGTAALKTVLGAAMAALFAVGWLLADKARQRGQP